MRNLIEQGLPVRITATQSEELNLAGRQVDLAADETVGPVSVDGKHMAQEGHLPLFRRASQIDDLAAYGLPEVQVKSLGHRRTPRRSLLAGGVAAAKGPEEAIRDAAQIPEAGMVEPLPDDFLPSAVEVLDLGLEAGLSGRGEDRGDSQKQTESRDPAHDVGVRMRSLESSVVVELGVGRPPVLAPAAQQARNGCLGRHWRGLGPGVGQASVQRDGRQDIDQRSVLDAKVFDQIEAVQFGLGGGDLRQVPTFRGRGATQTMLSVQGAATFQNPGDGSIRRDVGQTPVDQFLAESTRTILAERAMNLQVLSQVQKEVLHGRWRAAGMKGSAGLIGEIHPIQSLAGGVLNPALDGGLAEVELLGYHAQGQTPPDGTDEVPSLLCRRWFLFIGSSPKISFWAYGISHVPGKCPAGCGTSLSRRY